LKNHIKSQQHRLLRSLAWLLAPSCFPVFTSCYADNGISEQAYLQDFPVVLSASRLRQPTSETPNAVTVIDRDMIKASGFRNIADLFNMVPGMYVGYLNGSTPFLSSRGTLDSYTRRMQVLVDGRSVYLPPYNTVDWEDLPLHINDIERIEVVRGPAAPSYGLNSIMGVINIITRDAAALNDTSFSVTKGNQGGGNGVLDAVVHHGKSGDRLDYRVTLSAKSDNGLKYPAGWRNWYDGHDDSITTYIGNLRSNYHTAGPDSFDFQMGFSDSVQATGDPRRFSSPPHDVRKNSNFQQLTWLRTLGQQEDLQLSFYHIARNHTDETYTNDGLYWLSRNASAQRYELELQHTSYISSSNRFVWGMAIRRDSVGAPTLFLQQQSQHQSRLFANDEWRISSSLLLNAGAMLESNGMGAKKLSPRAALNYHLTPEHTFRASASVAYRNPALFEEKGNERYLEGTTKFEQSFLSSGGLRPERIFSREIGYVGNYQNGLSVDVRAYNDQVSDLIFFDPFYYLGPDLAHPNTKHPSYDFRNEFTLDTSGVEGTVKYNWGEQKNRLIANFAHQTTGIALVGTPKILTQSPFPGYEPVWGGLVNLAMGQIQMVLRDYNRSVPTNSFNLLYSRELPYNWSTSLGYYQQSAVYIISGERQPLTRRVDMRIAKRFGPIGEEKRIGGGEIALTVQNAFQHKKGEQIGYSGYIFDRRAYVTATLNF